MALPLPLAGAANLFVETFTAFDTTYTLINGRWTLAVEPDRLISGVIQSDKGKFDLVKSDGSLSDGTLILHTRDAVSMSDLSQSDGSINRQTYVKYKNETWKLNEIDVGWREKTQNYGRFILTKFTDISE